MFASVRKLSYICNTQGNKGNMKAITANTERLKNSSRAMRIADDLVAYYLHRFPTYHEAFGAALREAWARVKAEIKKNELLKALKAGNVGIIFTKVGQEETITRIGTRSSIQWKPKSKTRKKVASPWYFVNFVEPFAGTEREKWTRIDIRRVELFYTCLK